MARKRTPRDPEDQRVRLITRAIRGLLLERDLLVKDLDSLSGQAAGYGSQVLTGNVRLTFHHVFKWLDALDVPADEFFRRLATVLTPKPKLRNQPPDPQELDNLVRLVAKELARAKKISGRDRPDQPKG